MKIGVVIGRFQVPTLSLGHQNVLAVARQLFDRVIVIIGCSEVGYTSRNPLTFEQRKGMIQNVHPKFPCYKMNDHPIDSEWVKGIEEIIDKHSDLRKGLDWAYLIGGRDSCLEIYRLNGGKYNTINIGNTTIGASGTEMREACKTHFVEDHLYRAGIIHATQNQFPHVYPVVDVLVRRRDIINGKDSYYYLLGRKTNDEPGKWRLIGGFVDPKDYSYEMAARREVSEETGLEIGNLIYCGSIRVDDWRYRKGPDTVMSNLFMADRMFGFIKANDDIAELKWFERYELGDVIATVHKPLLEDILKHA